MLVQVLNISKSVPVLYILPTLFLCCIDILSHWTYLNRRFISFLPSRSLVNVWGKEEVFASVFLYIGHLSTVNDVIQAWFNVVVEIIIQFVLLDQGLNVMFKLLAEVALAMFMRKVDMDWSRSSSMPFHWLVL